MSHRRLKMFGPPMSHDVFCPEDGPIEWRVKVIPNQVPELLGVLFKTGVGDQLDDHRLKFGACYFYEKCQ